MTDLKWSRFNFLVETENIGNICTTVTPIA